MEMINTIEKINIDTIEIRIYSGSRTNLGLVRFGRIGSNPDGLIWPSFESGSC
jgi:hypothetical protein